MKDILSIIGVLAIVCCVSYFVQNINSNEVNIEDKTERIHELEYEIEELKAEIDRKEEYIEELQQLLEDNNIDEWDSIDIELTDGSNQKAKINK